ncbi:universal stress protein [Bosea thiooxidans]
MTPWFGRMSAGAGLRPDHRMTCRAIRAPVIPPGLHPTRLRQDDASPLHGALVMYQNILVATDGSKPATAAVKHAVDMARALDCRLTIVTIALQGALLESTLGTGTVSQSVFDEIRRANIEQCSAVLKKAAEVAGPAAHLQIVENLTVYEGILDAVKTFGADLVVMGSHSHNPISRLLLGSQASKVANLSEVPVLIIK